jgi:hypothetical protein
MDIGPDVAAMAETAGIIDMGARVSFRHPLLRSMVYSEASAAERRHAHAALADCCDPAGSHDRYAWHRGQAATGFDESATGHLEAVARGAPERPSPAASGSWPPRSPRIPGQEPSRLFHAARAKRDVGAFQEALVMLASLRQEPMPDLGRTRVAVMHARMRYVMRRDEEAVQSLLDTARRVAEQCTAVGVSMVLDGLDAVAFTPPDGSRRPTEYRTSWPAPGCCSRGRHRTPRPASCWRHWSPWSRRGRKPPRPCWRPQ